MRNQQDQRDQSPDNAGDRGMRRDRTIDDPRVSDERRAPGAENAEDELDDEDFEGEEDVRP